MNPLVLNFLCFLAGAITATASIFVLSALAMNRQDDDTTDHFATNPETKN